MHRLAQARNPFGRNDGGAMDSGFALRAPRNDEAGDLPVGQISEKLSSPACKNIWLRVLPKSLL
jgi:hypothetical protein